MRMPSWLTVLLLQLAALPASSSVTSLVEPAAEPAAPDVYGGRDRVAAYVIVTDNPFRGVFERLARARRQNGIPARVVTLHDIRRRFPNAADDAERVRRFLRVAYEAGTRWVLVGGDDTVVPMRRATLRVRELGATYRIPTDQYYACLDGTWNADGDDEWGELPSAEGPGDDVDLAPELFIGRAPVHSTAEARRFVDRTLDYEHASGPARTVLLAAGEFAGGIVDGAGLAERLRPIVTDPESDVTRLYANSKVWPGSVPETRVTLLRALAKGADLAVLIGAGGATGFAARDESDLVTVADAAAVRREPGLTNAYFFSGPILSPGPERFVGDALLLGRNTGVVSVVGSTSNSFIAQTNAFMVRYFEALRGPGTPRAGEALAAAIGTAPPASDVARLTYQGTQLYGDPMLELRLPATEAPRAERRIETDVASGVPYGALTSLAAESSVHPAATAAVEKKSASEPDLASTAARAGVKTAAAPMASGLALRIAGSSPSRTLAEFEIDIPADLATTPWSLTTFDLSGRKVRRLVSAAVGAGPQRVVWDLTSDGGARVKPGLYFAQLRIGATARSRLLVVSF